MPHRRFTTRDIGNIAWRELIHPPTPYSKMRHLDTLPNDNRTTCNKEETTIMALSLRSAAALLVKSHEVSVYAVWVGDRPTTPSICVLGSAYLKPKCTEQETRKNRFIAMLPHS